MIRRRASTRVAVAALIAALLLYLALLGFRATRSGLSWREMDRDHDGRTSIAELIDAADVDRRIVKVTGRECVELYYLKDGLRAKLVCPAD